MGNVDHSSTGSEVLHSGEIAAMSSKFAEGYARVREVTDSDSACPAWAKAMYMAGAAAVRGQVDLLNREIVRSRDFGLKLSDARGAALAVLISRGYIELMADEAPRALEGYVLMREWSLAENTLDAKHVELLLCTINAAEFSSRFVNVHANGARNAGATEAEIVESVICAIPVSGVASWLPGADGIMEGR